MAGTNRDPFLAIVESGASPRERGTAMHQIAHSYIDEGRPDLADGWFDRLAALEGAHPHHRCEAVVARGYRFRAQGKLREALREFEAAIAMPDGMSIHRGSARYHAALTWLDLEDRKRAREELTAFLAMPQVYPDEKKRAEELLERWKE